MMKMMIFKFEDIFLLQIKKILNQCQSVQPALSVGNLILNALSIRTAVRLSDIDAEKIDKYKRDKQ